MKILRPKWIALASSLILFAAILYLLDRKQGLDAIIDVWRRTDGLAFGIAVLLMLVVQAITAYRLKIITGVEALHSISYQSILRIQFISQFIAYGAPISALSDLAKAAMLKLRFDLSLARSITFVLYERICGALGAVVIGLVATLGQLALPLPKSLLEVQFSVWGAGLLVTALILFLGEFKISSGITLLDRASRGITALAAMLRHPTVAGQLLLVSSLQILGYTAVFSTLAQGMQISISRLDILLFMPFIFLISALPIFYQGWGGREAAVILTIGSLGTASNAQCIALSVAVGVATAMSSLPGAVFWIARPSMRKSVRLEVERT